MRECPSCKKEIKKRKDEACPHCGQAVSLDQGNFYRTEDGAPNVAIVAEFEQLVSQQLSKAASRPVPFRIHRKSANYTLELITAESLLSQSDYDLDLVKRTLHELFNNQAWSWMARSWTSLTQVKRVYPGALAVARVAAQIADADQARQLNLADQIAKKEDVFG
jgi:hypothetical protein